MDAVTLSLIGIAAVAFGPKLIHTAATTLIVKSGEWKKKREKEKKIQETYRPTKKQLEEKKRREEIIAAKVQVDKFRFRGIQSKKDTMLTLKEMSRFDPEKDELIHGKLKVMDKDGKITVEDIYMYQPRVLSGNGSLLGPKKEKNGNISAKNCYLCRSEDGQEILRGYIPKREIFSNLCYDFDVKSPQPFIDRFPDLRSRDEEEQKNMRNVERFIQIEFDKDEFGNYIPVNLQDEKQRLNFKKYIAKQAKNNNPRDYFITKLKIAEAALEDYLEKTKPKYARVNIQRKDETMLKVEKSKKAEPKNDYSFYNMYNYYTKGDQLFGNDKQIGHNMGPHFGHGPRR